MALAAGLLQNWCDIPPEIGRRALTEAATSSVLISVNMNAGLREAYQSCRSVRAFGSLRSRLEVAVFSRDSLLREPLSGVLFDGIKSRSMPSPGPCGISR